jgi:hypothetical protein
MGVKDRICTMMIITTILFSCGSSGNISNQNVIENQCDECEVIPKSGMNKDLREGYYYDSLEEQCKIIRYSTGRECTPPPFKTMEQCASRCESRS